ncbi:MAG: DUF3991 and toprim domain-containing protein [Lachnospiraceae bacterium]|nr:DUF3991 and toprim domain-containing protein [Lachnospiraceae bacterium]
MILGGANNPSDKIIVKNTSDKSQQVYFRRNGSRGDVVTFIRENLSAFNVEGKGEWTRVANVLAQLSNTPISHSEKSYISSSASTNKTFDPARYDIYKIKEDKIPFLLKNRGFNSSCIMDFGNNVVLLKDNYNSKYDGFNIGFPYTNPETEALTGYEIRGNKGFKSKASGTDSSNSAWIAEFPKGNPENIRNVYFFESSFDAMAFYQLNKAKLNISPFALVSVGGAFSPKLAQNIMHRFPTAKAWDCFDNDLAGQIYSANLVKAIDKTDFEIKTNDQIVSLRFGGKEFQCPRDEFDFRSNAASLGMSYSCGHWKSPTNFKDWNDCLLGKQIQISYSPSKYLRDENLANQRQSAFKM